MRCAVYESCCTRSTCLNVSKHLCLHCGLKNCFSLCLVSSDLCQWVCHYTHTCVLSLESNLRLLKLQKLDRWLLCALLRTHGAHKHSQALTRLVIRVTYSRALQALLSVNMSFEHAQAQRATKENIRTCSSI
jgi:hypothetical protein